ncbi:unnamed protein product [Mytilus edulis]|uniref:Uncharacterized protein n=1 Tax=Mytilus edulis TaxID=6550 RepID=A0A8S3T881_MYTED|nr:unnamed protein product [Mytilus edulis]
MEYNVLIYSCWTERCWIVIVLRYGIQCVVIQLLDRTMLDRHSSEVWSICVDIQLLDRKMLDRHNSSLGQKVWNTCVVIQLLDRKMLDRHSSELLDRKCLIYSCWTEKVLDRCYTVLKGIEYNVLLYSCWTERCWIVIVLRYGIQCVDIQLLDRKMLDRHSSELLDRKMLGRHSSEVWNTMCCYTAAGQKDAGSS